MGEVDLTYRGSAERYEKVEDIPGERAMHRKAADIILAYAQKHHNKSANSSTHSFMTGISLLDLCCGTTPILVSYLPVDRNDLIATIAGVDINKGYLDFAKRKCEDVTLDAHVQSYGTGADVKFILHDAVNYTHPKLVDVILASSAYHHIEDERKVKFLEKIHSQLKDDGIAVFCENLIGDYNNLHERDRTVSEFYAKRIIELARLGITDERLDLVYQVLDFELKREYEWKHSYRMFMENLRQTGFHILEEHKVWPSTKMFDDEKVGDFVIVAKKK